MNSFLLKILRLRKVLLGKDLYIKRQIKAGTLSSGNPNASWTILPDMLNSKSIIYSFGVGTDISFDLHLIEKFNAKVYAFDPTPKSINWVKSLKLPDNFIFHPLGIDAQDGKKDFFPEFRTGTPKS